jgi:hypothetical protein
MKILTNDGRGVIEIDADVIRGEIGFTNFYKKRSTTLERPAYAAGIWPFRRTMPATQTTTTRDEWVLSLAPDTIVEIRPAQAGEARSDETSKSGSARRASTRSRAKRDASKD